ncbi:MAG TPA: class I SAM-dependent methyltransferase [Pyrinomonadaceae bacterium]|nr:class I SAM-dependent methyltransferase [Pyrinomonadaceae bacterium]
MKRDITKYIELDNLDLELFICSDILKLNSLHYGYWESDQELSLDNVRKAQTRYTSELLNAIPAGVASVLDVGCGIGDNARALAASGYNVTALSPDKNHAKYFENGNGHAITFHNQRFEEFQADQKFDLILMSESQNYFEAKIAFRQCLQFLNPGGHLLICGMFRKEETSVFKHVRNVEDDFIGEAVSHGLQLTSHTDITDHVLPTLKFANQAHRNYLEPSLALLKYYFRQTSPLKLRLLKLVWGKQLKNFQKIYQYYDEFFDPILFKKHVRYLTLLFTLNERE